ncbi:hypothetical protein ACH42_09635 [Endozoicomonas sp. (ex Bugula neritina AB1)]|nr:hypothetical protein ACH42_09635 [Endozoicomonas sp. (ex Bugula neritina AB1)]
MKTYLVGGAVRDKLLGLPVKDNDWVVTGSTPEEMKQQGYIPVGKDFPVFLHPKNQEEYALARTEKKSGHGYAGFVFHTSPEVSIEEDLIRRDLTINAIAEDEDGQLIDPHQGQQDLKHKLLRHVSPAFQEDPLRVLRVARFAARFHNHGFTIADETMKLMTSMVKSGETEHLVAERVWQETIRALMEPAPQVYFETLQDCGALKVVLPELHEFITHSNNVSLMQAAAQKKATDVVRFGCLFAGSEQQLSIVKSMSQRMRLPVAFADIATLVVKHSLTIPDILLSSDAESLMTLFEQTDAIRRPERFAGLLACTGFISQGAISENIISQTKHHLKEVLSMNAKSIVAQGFKGKEIGEQLRTARVAKLTERLI